MHFRLSSLLFIFLVAVLCSACATAPRVGVRPGFASATVASIAVAPVWSSSSFGIAASEWEELRATYAHSVVRELSTLGFKIIPPAELRSQLDRRGALDELEDISTFSRGLVGYFEADMYDREPREVTVLRALAASDRMQAEALLVSEIVYQSSGLCTTDPREYNPHAEVVVDGRPARRSPAEGQCVVSHFEAKLVDAATGRTMWHNRFLREVRLESVSEQTAARNIEETVRKTLLGEFGVARFARQRAAAAAR